MTHPIRARRVAHFESFVLLQGIAAIALVASLLLRSSDTASTIDENRSEDAPTEAAPIARIPIAGSESRQSLASRPMPAPGPSNEDSPEATDSEPDARRIDGIVAGGT